ncbi:flagellin [Brenneria roseae subsp. roseae]|uniref:Flagellin n=1 Tax=Brenneria goodwinii TaxID=1109412 RepID=A0A0G4JXK7_9GAMM|nr:MULTISPECIES: flagellin [Brenneria]PWC22896.1 flagellin [Brenneria roseae subsp. roseae]CPR18202.1 Flagellin protein FlaA [Brenneria goodwinii]
MIPVNTLYLTILNQQGKSSSSLSQAIERLASGIRINSAKDDAAGQAISNRMTSQYHGLSQAKNNANDGISLLQTAEGTLDEINRRLQRIRELTVQGLNGTYSQEQSDAIQAEINMNLKEIDRLTSQTSYNSLTLLDGSSGQVDIQVGANDGETLSLDFSPPGFSVDELGLTDLVISGISGEVYDENTLTGAASNIILDSTTTTTSYYYPDSPLTSPTFVRSGSNNRYYIQAQDEQGKPVYYLAAYTASHDTATGNSTATIRAAASSELYTPVTRIDDQDITTATLSFTDSNGNTIDSENARLLQQGSQYILEVDDGSGNYQYYNAAVTVKTDGTDAQVDIVASSGTAINIFSDVASVSGTSSITIDSDNVVVNYTDSEGNQYSNVLTEDADGNYVMNISDDGVSGYKSATIVSQADNSLLLKTINGSREVQIYYEMNYTAYTDASTNQTVINISEVGEGIRLRNPENPLAAIDNAISLVDEKRSSLGAMENRLESVMNVQTNTTEAIRAARSRIADADYAVEVSAMVRAQILQQTTVSMLSQANQQSEIVLTLLQE